MRKRLASVCTLLLAALILARPAPAAPRSAPEDAPAGSSHAGTLTDRDADRISDAFEPELDAAATSDRFAVIVTFRPGTKNAAAQARASVGAFPTSHEYRIIPGFAGEMSAAQIRGLAKNPNVHRIEEDIRIGAALDYSRADFGIDRARANFPGVTGAGIDVCVADTGVDPLHEQLSPRTIAWTDTTPAASATPVDPQGHGTHVASILLGDGTGGALAPTFGGVAPAANLFAARVLDADGFGEDSWIIEGVQWCVDQGVDLISMSIGTIEGSDGLDGLSVAVNNAAAAGVAVVVAAGNSGDAPQSVGSPGAASGAITVGAAAEWSAPPNAGAGRHSDGVYLAPFSSRGPTVGGAVVKPDVVGPGVTVTAAMASTKATYVTFSGTSMATPFVAGTVALALQAAPSLTPAGLRALIEGTAQDRGAAGKDNDWGAGLLDGYAVVAEAAGAGSYAPTEFPSYERHAGSVGDGGLWTFELTVGPDDLDVPIAAMITADGSKLCTLPWHNPPCLAWEWSPDLEARLRAPNGVILSESTCAADDECGIGRQETVHAMPTVAGTYRIEVYPFADWPNYGLGGSFWLELSRGPVGSGPPPPPDNDPPVANAGLDQTVADDDGNGSEDASLNGSGSTDPDGTIASHVWSEGGTQIATGPAPAVLLGVGAHTITLTVTDDAGATHTDTVVVTVNANQVPVANAGADQTQIDTNGDGSEPVTLNGGGSSDADGAIASYVWSEGGTEIATGVSPAVTLGVGAHTITLTVTDNGGATHTDTVMVTVTHAATATTVHVGDLDAAMAGRGGKTPTFTITVHDGNHNPVAGVTVTGSWSSGGTGSCVTDANGRCSLSKAFARKQTTVTFTVTGLTKSGYAYDAGSNHDPDGDSNGTSITFTKP